MSDKSSNLANLSSIIKMGVESRLKELHTSMPGTIETFDPETQIATIKPAIKRIFVSEDEDGVSKQEIELPLLINVPVAFFRGGGFTITSPVKSGDECLVIFSERSFDIWLEKAGVQLPGAKRMHSLSDGIAYVGLSSKPNVIPDFDPDNLHIKKDDGTVFIRVKSDSSLEVYAESQITVTTESDIIATCSGDAVLNATGNVTVNTEADATVNATGNVSVQAGGTADVESAGAMTLKAPTITLNGNVSVTGTLAVGGAVTMAAGAAVTGDMTNNGVDIGSDHKHGGSPTAPNGPVSNTGAPL